MPLIIKSFTGNQALVFIDDLAQLRIEVFREFPYLYDGSLQYEQEYLQTFIKSPDCIIVVAFDGKKVVGVSTGKPMEYEAPNVQKPWLDADHDLSKIFCFGESVLQKQYRGRGIGVQFFVERENWARELKRFRQACFCAVIRENDHALRPVDYVPLDAFWTKRGFTRMDQYICKMQWKETVESSESEKKLMFWKKDLT